VTLTSSNYYSVVVNLSQESAFICNQGSHWFSIRKVLPEEWYNFNSLLEEPQHMKESFLASFLDDLFDKKDVSIYLVKGNLPNISPANRPASASGRWILATGSNREEFELKIAIEESKLSITENNPSSGSSLGDEISYPKLPEFKNEKISYPTLESIQEEQPLISKKQVVQPKIDTKNLSFNDHLKLINDYFVKCLNNMEKFDQRLTNLERSFAKIQSKQK